jgi:hypothetical protein
MGKLVRAAIKDAERSSRRRQRELQAMAKESARQAERDQAAYQVEVFQNQLELLTSLHREATPPVDWRAHASAARPGIAAPDRSTSVAAREALERYRPGFFARLLGLDARNKLEQRLANALAAEAARQAQLEEAHAAAVEQWEAHREYANAVLAGDQSLYNEVLRDTACLEELERIHFDRADASDVVSSFVHAMKLSRGKGLGAVQPLTPEDFLPKGGTMRVV